MFNNRTLISSFASVATLLVFNKPWTIYGDAISDDWRLDGPIKMTSPCMIKVKVTMLEGGGSRNSLACEMSPEDGGRTVPIQGNARRSAGDDIVSGVSTLFSPEALLYPDRLLIPEEASVEMGELVRAQNASVEGDMKILIVRVVARDVAVSFTEEELSDGIFGTFGDSVNLKSQYDSCSYGKVNVIPVADQIEPKVTNGVVTMNIDMKVNGADSSTVEFAVKDKYYDMGFSQPDVGGYVVFCIPSGTTFGGDYWIGYAYINSWESFYNDDWCTYVSIQMHEVGHNINLDHSGQGGDEYNDGSGVMGYSYAEDDTPVMCFTAPKYWQVGWYDDRIATLSTAWKGEIVGIAEYDLSEEGQYVAVRIKGSTVGARRDYFISFNRMKDGTCISDTRESPNKVLIHSREPGTGVALSELVAAKNPGDSHKIGDATIKVLSINTDVNPGIATIEVNGGSLDECLGLKEKKCKKKKKCTFTEEPEKKKYACKAKKEEYDFECDSNKDKYYCESFTSGVCRWEKKKSKCTHKCKVKNKKKCKKQKNEYSKKICKWSEVDDPCVGCHQKDTCA